MLASLLFPFDNDAQSLMDGWLTELEREHCIVRYEVDGDKYLEVTKWLKHQRIDKPSPSRLPPFANVREAYKKVREASTPDLGPRTIGSRTLDQQDSVATQLAPAPVPTPLDFKKELWNRGVPFLQANGLSEREARSMLGKWRKSHGDLEVLNALATAEGSAVSEPIPYVQAVLNAKEKANGAQKPSQLDELKRIVERERLVACRTVVEN